MTSRRPAVLALGLLGALHDEAETLAATGDPADVSAAVPAVVLNDPAAALDQVTRIGARAQSAEAARIAENALLRIRRKRFVSVIE